MMKALKAHNEKLETHIEKMERQNKHLQTLLDSQKAAREREQMKHRNSMSAMHGKGSTAAAGGGGRGGRGGRSGKN